MPEALEPVRSRGRLASGPGEGDDTCQHANLPADGPERASRELLTRLARDHEENLDPGASSRRSFLPHFGKPGKKVSSPEVPRSEAGERWLDAVADRTTRVFRQNAAAPSSGRKSSLDPTVGASEGQRSLAEQWGLPFDGPSAPDALLFQLVGPWTEGEARSGEFDDSAPMKGNESGSMPPNRRPGQRPAPPEPGSVAPFGAHHAWHEGGELSPPGRDGTGLDPTGDSSPAVRPPILAETLPPLGPAKRIDDPVPDLTASLARLEMAREERVRAGDGLDVLAEKIKLILDEEARRHGIDV